MKAERLSASILISVFISVVAFIGGVFHLCTGGVGTVSSMTQTVMHWLVMFSIVFLIYPKKREHDALTMVLTLLAIAVGVYILLTWEGRVNRLSSTLSPLEMILAVILVFLVLEASRRVTGNFLAITALTFIVYAKIGSYLPGILQHKGYSWYRILSTLCYSENGVFGNALGISSTFIVLFVMFGSILNASNGGKLFIDIAYSLTGGLRGGPAKTAVLSSLLMGTISGSPVANVVTTGTFTIPLMKRSGYDSEEACAVEAVSSTGGQIMPPVMGAAAFLVAQNINMNYGTLCISAFIPAFLYYLSLYLIIDLLSVKKGLLGLPKDQLPLLPESLRKGVHLFIPIAVLIFGLISGYSSMKSVFFSMIVLVVIAELRPSTRMSFKQVIRAIEDGVSSTVPVAVSCATAGIIVGIVNLTGLGVRFSSSLMTLSGGSIFVALLFTMLASLILGCGLPTTAVYIILSSLAAPALIQMGVMPISAHMFVFYFGCISTITPPVALTSYAAAGIGEASPSKTGLKAFFFGFVAYVIPFMFVFEPALLAQGSLGTVAYSILTALIGIFFLSSSVAGYMLGPLDIVLRIILALGGGLLIHGGLITDLIGVSILFLVLLYQAFKKKHSSIFTKQINDND